MASTIRGIGLFTAENIAAILKAVPETNGTYSEIAERAGEISGTTIGTGTLSRWVTVGNQDIKRGKKNTAFARFARLYARSIEEHCNMDANRNREMDRALNLINSICDCGNTKEILPGGEYEEACAKCKEMDAEQAPKRRGRTCSHCDGDVFKNGEGRPVCLHCGREQPTGKSRR